MLGQITFNKQYTYAYVGSTRRQLYCQNTGIQGEACRATLRYIYILGRAYETENSKRLVRLLSGELTW
jgi:hypothetical protein